MNETERRGYSWLTANRGYSPKSLVFQRFRSPDFLSPDGRGWEVKRVRNGTVTLYATQLEALREHPDVTVLCFDGEDEPIAVLPFDELQVPGYCGGLRFVLADNSEAEITLPPDVRRRLVDVALRERRSVSDVVASVFRDWLAAH